MTTWTTPQDIKAIVRKAWDRGDVLSSHLSGTPPFPKTIALTRPETRELGDRFADVQAWIAELERGSARGGYAIEWEEINNRQVGKNRVPRRVLVHSPSDAASLIGKGQELKKWDQLVAVTLTRFPPLRDWVLRRPLTVLEHSSDWDRVLAVLQWFIEHPRPGVYIRQMDVAAVDTKFIESRRALFSELLDLVLPASAIRTDAVGAKDFEARYGLKAKPARLRFRYLDESQGVGGLSDVETLVADFARSPLQIEQVVIVENEINYLTFPAMPMTIVVFGVGYGVDRLEDAAWLGSRRLFYWGDLDTHGFAILDMLRAYFPAVESFLMDRETLLSHKDQWVIEEDRRDAALQRLTPLERELYDELLGDAHGLRVRLEQERVRYGAVLREAAALLQRSKRSTSWVEARETKNWVIEDPLLDWLDVHGAAMGLKRDDERTDYDPKIDFGLFVAEKTELFRQQFVARLASHGEIVTISADTDDDRVEQTLANLRLGAALIVGGKIRNERRRTTASPDLLVRSDLWSSIVPGALATNEVRLPAPAIGHKGFHYHPVTIAWRTFETDVDGRLVMSADHLPYAIGAWCAADALGEVQGHAPSAFLVGRPARDEHNRSSTTVARVELSQRAQQRTRALGAIAHDAIDWIRRLREQGSQWRVLPTPSVPELYPHARNQDDAPWHGAKREISIALDELTLLPGMTPRRRRQAHAIGIHRWSDPRLSAAAVGVGPEHLAVRFELVLAANRSPKADVFPDAIPADTSWRAPAPIEFYVDFETAYDLVDDRVRRIAQIGCGHTDADGAWRFGQWTVDSLSHDDERRVLDAWLGHMDHASRDAGFALEAARICHWSAAERSAFDSAYDAARTRHTGNDWPLSLPWFDVLERVIRAAPFAVTGAFDFGLKSIAKAMHRAGFIATTWEPNSLDGLGAMVGLMRVAESGAKLSEHPLTQRIARYNEADCRAMMEILRWLRAHR